MRRAGAMPLVLALLATALLALPAEPADAQSNLPVVSVLHYVRTTVDEGPGAVASFIVLVRDGGGGSLTSDLTLVYHLSQSGNAIDEARADETTSAGLDKEYTVTAGNSGFFVDVPILDDDVHTAERWVTLTIELMPHYRVDLDDQSAVITVVDNDSRGGDYNPNNTALVSLYAIGSSADGPATYTEGEDAHADFRVRAIPNIRGGSFPNPLTIRYRVT